MRTIHKLATGMALVIFTLYPTLGSSEGLQKRFIIGGWVGPHQTEEQYRLYREAGFTTVLDYPWEDDKYQKTIELAQKVGGLSVILNIDHQFLRYKPEPFVPYERIAKFVTEVQKNKVVLGYHLFDEPAEKDAALLAETGKHIRSLDPDKMTWIDFYPYTDDLLARSVILKSKPSVIAVNFYPYRAKGDKLDGYYEVVEHFRSLSLESGTPLWLFVQSVAQIWPPDRRDDMRMPTPPEMRLQVYINLAYGARGLWYYTYAVPHNFKDISAAILDRGGKPTPAYATVKQLNREVLTLGPLLMTLTSVDVMHVKPYPKGGKPFAPNDIIAGIDGSNLLVGTFKDESGGSYFMLVNKLADRANRNIRLQLQGKVTRLSRIDRASGLPVQYPVTGGSAVVNLDLGDGMLFKVN